MTESDFRSNPAFVDRMREIFSDPVYQAFLIMLKDSAPIFDALDADPEIVSVRRLSKLAGYDECMSRHFAASLPLQKPPAQIPETWEPAE